MHQTLDGYCATLDGCSGWFPYNKALENIIAERSYDYPPIKCKVNFTFGYR